MNSDEIKKNLRNKIEHSAGEELQLISFFLYNWTEGPWTPDPLTEEQIAELKKRVEETERGDGVRFSTEEVLKELKEKYGFVREKNEAYKAELQNKERVELIEMLDHVSDEQLLQLELYVDSQGSLTKKETLSNAEWESIQRGKSDSEQGRIVDAFRFMEMQR